MANDDKRLTEIADLEKVRNQQQLTDTRSWRNYRCQGSKRKPDNCSSNLP